MAKLCPIELKRLKTRNTIVTENVILTLELGIGLLARQKVMNSSLDGIAGLLAL